MTSLDLLLLNPIPQKYLRGSFSSFWSPTMDLFWHSFSTFLPPHRPTSWMHSLPSLADRIFRNSRPARNFQWFAREPSEPSEGTGQGPHPRIKTRCFCWSLCGMHRTGRVPAELSTTITFVCFEFHFLCMSSSYTASASAALDAALLLDTVFVAILNWLKVDNDEAAAAATATATERQQRNAEISAATTTSGKGVKELTVIVEEEEEEEWEWNKLGLTDCPTPR